MKQLIYNNFNKEEYDKLLEIMNCVKVGIYITNGNGDTLLVNDESCKTGGMAREDVTGRNMRELEEIGFIKESVTLKTLRSGREESMIQDLGDGGQVYVTGVPFYREGRIEYVVCTERDITEMVELKEILKEKEQKEKRYEKEIEYLRNGGVNKQSDILTVNHSMKLLAEKALRVAKLDTTILLTGESGTGKEIFANLIYKNSTRLGETFLKINCAAIPENLLESELFGYEKGAFTGADKEGKMGIFELADKGTLFLDEIGELSIQMQSKLLRAIQEQEIMRVGGKKPIRVDVRIIAATNRDLKEEIEKGNFRKDLYYRLNIMPLEILPLRERKGDIGLLAKVFVGKFSRKYEVKKKITEDAITALQKHSWPGNVRELENIIERLVISFDSAEITRYQVNKLLNSEDDAGDRVEISEGATLEEMMEAYEKKVLAAMLGKHKKAADVCRALNVNKSTLSRRLDKYGLKEGL